MPDEKTGRLDEDYVVQMKGITKVYPNGVAANQGVDFNLRRGEIHALMGENGAGKSTLMKMLFGLEQPTSGEIWVHGEKLTLSSPTVAISHGIGMVHQHFMLVPSLTVAENMVLGMAPRKGLFIDHAKAVAITKEYAEKYNLHVEPEAKVMDIPVGMKQKVEILKALVRGAKILILDEPTAVLTTQETVELFKELRHLKEQGYTIVFISHKLNEIMEITDRLTIMRGGRSMGVYNTCDVTKEEISRLMVGRDVILNVQKDKAQPSDVVLRVRDVEYVNEWHKKMLDKISFDVRRGEILGIAGVEGNGQSELADALVGFTKADGGKITICGTDVTNRRPGEVRAAGLTHIPEDRNKHGLNKALDIKNNLAAVEIDRAPYSKHGIIDRAAIVTEAKRRIEKFDIRPANGDAMVKSLSGGNAQKVIVARELDMGGKILLANQPTRGVDIGAIESIRNLISSATDSGAAVLLISADLDEILSLADRIIVLYEGRVNGEIMNDGNVDEMQLGLMMLGGKVNG